MSVPRFNDLTNPFQRARSMSGISQSALAKDLRVGQPAISMWELGARCPEPITAKRFVEWCRKRKIRMSMDEIYANLEP